MLRDLGKMRNEGKPQISILNDWTDFDFTYYRSRGVKQILEEKIAQF